MPMNGQMPSGTNMYNNPYKMEANEYPMSGGYTPGFVGSPANRQMIADRLRQSPMFPNGSLPFSPNMPRAINRMPFNRMPMFNGVSPDRMMSARPVGNGAGRPNVGDGSFVRWMQSQGGM